MFYENVDSVTGNTSKLRRSCSRRDRSATEDDANSNERRHRTLATAFEETLTDVAVGRNLGISSQRWGSVGDESPALNVGFTI